MPALSAHSSTTCSFLLSKLNLAILATVALSAVPAWADDPPAEDPTWPGHCTDHWYPHDPNEPCGEPNFVSRCYNGGPFRDNAVPYAGFPMNFALWHGPTSPSLPPLSLDPALSTMPLIARAVPFFQGPNPKAERPVLNGVMDLLTGTPLLREVDFELPFGGAVFRHIRTFADPVSYKHFGTGGGLGDDQWVHSSWDWNGHLWMMSENPLLLIDGAYADITYDPAEPNAPLPQYTYLILDAHHTIPFRRDGDDYVTEPWLDAILSCENNDPDTATEFYVWLNRQSIKYTFEVHREDQWLLPEESTCGELDSHAPPPNGQGIPYYGFLTKIEDRYGNRTELTYAEQFQETVDLMGAPHPSCDICMQNCNEKGQVHTVRLIPAGEETAAWTLVYTYRPFSPYTFMYNSWYGNPDLGEPLTASWYVDPTAWHRFYPTQLHSIHVYAGDRTTSGFVAMLPLTKFYCEPDPNDPNAPLDGDQSLRVKSFDAYDDVKNDTLPGEDWAIACNYVYTEWDRRWYTSLDPNGPYADTQYALAGGFDPNNDIFPIDEASPWVEELSRLVKVTVTTRKEGGESEDEPLTRRTIYRHELSEPGFGRWSGVTHVYYDSALNRILKGYADGGGDPNITINDLLAKNIDDIVWNYNAQNDASFQTTLSHCADLEMPYHVWGDPSWEDQQTIIQEVGLSSDLTGPRTVQVRRGMTDRRQDQKDYKFLWFVVHDPPPNSWDGEWPGFWNQNSEQPSRSEVHPPYRASYLDVGSGYEHYVSFPGMCLGNPDFGPWQFRRPPLDREFYVAVVDEYGVPPEPNQLPDPNDPNAPLDPPDPQQPRHLSRRAVGSNIWGIVVWDQTWSFVEDPNGVPVESGGFRESYKYDQYGRVIEKRTPGWSATLDPNNGADPNSEGLIYQYLYTVADPNDPNDPNNGTTELEAIGVKYGLNGTPHWLESYLRGEPNRPDLVTAAYQYHTPSNTLHDTDAADLTQTAYELDAEDAVTQMTLIKPAIELYDPVAAEPVWLYPTEKTAYDEKGNETLRGIGRLEDPESPSTGVGEFFITTRAYDEDGLGNLTELVVDADSDDPNFPRRVLDDIGNPLELTSTFEYDPLFGLKKAVYPDGRETHIVFKQDENDPNVYTHWTYRDVEGGVAHSPVEINRIEAGQVVNKKRVAFTSSLNLDGTDTFIPEWIVEEWVAVYDEAGAFRGLEKVAANFRGDIDDDGDVDQADMGVILAAWGTSTGQTGFVAAADLDGNGVIGQGDLGILTPNYGQTMETLSASVDYSESGLLNRLVDANRTITRYIYDNLGRLERTFRGTNDDHVFWGTVINFDPNDPYYPDDNMFLVEKRYYGEGVTDANRLIGIRSYRDKVTNQYHFNDPNVFGENNEDNIGWITTHEYDWRMRQVCEQVQEPTDPNVYAITKTTLTWLDHMDRPCFVAEFTGDADLGGVDPRATSPGDDLPSAADILGEADPSEILSLSETIYNGLGLVAEQRTYDVSETDPNALIYTSTVTYYNHAGQPVRVESPGSPTRHYAYDAKGRQVIARELSDTLEVTRTETTYDQRDRATQTEHWERLHDATDPTLDQDTGVPSFVHTWYDEAGRVVATANYGTNTHDTFTSGGSNPAYDPDPNNAPTPAPTGPQVTRTSYDEAGRVASTTHPDGTVTEYHYDDLGRQAMVVENADGAEEEIRRTAYRYDPDSGQLAAIAAVLPAHGITAYGEIDWQASDGSLQVTALEYGADVVDSEFALQSVNLGFIKRVEYPNPATGQPDATRFLQFTYLADGSVASREDARGIVLQYAYDDQKRLAEVLIDDSAWFGNEPDYAPLHRVARVTYEYTADGDLTLVTAYDPNDAIIAQNAFDYDGYGDLLYDRQQHFGAASGGSPTTSYDWLLSSASGGNNVSRLIGISYPDAGSGSREVGYGYGAANSVDDNFNRIAAIHEGSIAGPLLAGYDYAGISRRVGTTLGCGVATSVAGGDGYDGLDRFGRLLRLHWEDGGLLHGYDYSYDQAGNRLTAAVSQVSGGATLPDRSYEYGYDGLRRLVDAKLGELDPNGHVLPSTNTPVPRHTQWLLDNLGNFSGGDPNSGSVILIEDDGNGDPQTTLTHHATGSDNAIQSVTVDPPGGSPATQAFVYDIAGNLVFDGAWFYQYDGLNRLVQVNAVGSLTAGDFATNGAPDDPNTFEPGDLMARYMYDGLGRLIVRQVPLSRGYPLTDPGNPYLQSEQYYYDGVRRVQSVITRDPNHLYELEIVVDPAFGNVDAQEVLEYVWGPDYVDEMVCQYDDPNGDPFWALTDANYNVMAIVDGDCEVVEQYVYDPYGGLLAVETLDPNTAPTNRVAHQGLFFERFADDILSPPLDVGAPGVYENRTRKYEPYLSRFLQKDMNGAGCAVSLGAAFLGERNEPPTVRIDLADHFGDGINLFAYVRANPVTGNDPTGLFVFADILGGAYIGAELDMNTLDMGATFLSVFQGFAQIIENRNLELEEFAEAAEAGTIDDALAQIESSNRRLHAMMTGKGLIAIGLAGRLGENGLPADFSSGPRDHTVYVGYDPHTKKPVAIYAGRTNDIARRGREWQGVYNIRPYRSNLTYHEARAVEQILIVDNPHFKNLRNSISPRHSWYTKALDWARKLLKGKRTRF